MLYPDSVFIDRDPRYPDAHTLCLDVFCRCEAPFAGLDSSAVRDRFRLINRLLDDDYRSQGYRVVWGMFSSPENISLPDYSCVSDIFDVREDDQVIAVGVTREDHMKQYMYPDPQAVVRSLFPLDYLVLGGFHLSDCLRRIASGAAALGVPSQYDLLLTDHFFYACRESFDHDFFKRAIASGYLDPEMHEDDPDEDKKLCFDGRLDTYL